MMYSKQSSPTRRLRVMAIVPATVVGMMLLNVPQVNGAISSMASARFNPMAESDAKVTTIMPKRQTKQPSAVTSTVTPRITQQFVANQEKSSDRATTSAANGTTDNKPQATQAEKPTDKGDRTVLAPECLPKFKGGEAEMFRFIHSAIQYPQNALDAQLQGMVVVQFDITPDGDVTDATVVKSVAPILDAEAIRVIESTSGHWTPGTMNGERVTCRFTMPVSFKLQADPNPSK